MNLLLGDCLEIMRSMETDSVDLVFCSPPYEAARTYGIDFNLRGQDWVDWAVVRFVECVRVCRGMVCWVVEGQTSDFRWSAAPALLMADLHRAGVHLRKPPAFKRVGIPGSGGPDWFRNDYEFIVCGSKGGKLPWSKNTAMGHPPKWGLGGEMSYRNSDGTRRNQGPGIANRNGSSNESNVNRCHDRNICEIANPGNVIKCNVGGGVMGLQLTHENEAPFPETLAEFFIRSCCRQGGTTLDPFCGSGTTLGVAKMTGRKFIGIDVRECQIELSKRRLAEVQRELIS